MRVKIQAVPANYEQLKSECLIVPVYTDKPLSKGVQLFDKKLKGFLKQVVSSGDFSAEAGQTMLLPLPAGSAASCQRVLLAGLGKSAEYDSNRYRQALAALFQCLLNVKVKSAHLVSDQLLPKGWSVVEGVKALAIAGQQHSYRYQTTLSEKKPPATLKSLTLLSNDRKNTAAAVKAGQAIGTGINTARELGNLPGNICTPRYLGRKAQSMGRKYDNLSVSVLGDKKLAALGMNSMLSVARGSKEPAQLISMHYKGAQSQSEPLVIVGKGITFDTGGISLKPGAEMDEMKFDMCGAASVFGVITALAEMKAPVHVVGVVAAAENMPGSQATKPGDIVTSMSGKTIEILNTDAEGRLVLCDALTYVERYKPRAVIDIATLTGAVIIALGHHKTGLFSNDDRLANSLFESGERSGNFVWRLPLGEAYSKQLKSNFADLANIGGRSAGSVTAASFLAEFAGKYPWAHLDIAGTAWHSGEKKGATGVPVALLVDYILGQ